MPTGTKVDYQVGYGKPPRDAGFKKGQSGNPRGRPPGSKNLTSLLNDALNEPVTITENGRRRKITKRETVIKQLVNKSASADARSLKILLDLMLNLEARALGLRQRLFGLQRVVDDDDVRTPSSQRAAGASTSRHSSNDDRRWSAAGLVRRRGCCGEWWICRRCSARRCHPSWNQGSFSRQF